MRMGEGNEDLRPMLKATREFRNLTHIDIALENQESFAFPSMSPLLGKAREDLEEVVPDTVPEATDESSLKDILFLCIAALIACP